MGSITEFSDLVSKIEYTDKPVIVYFYDPNDEYCMHFLSTFNNLFDYFMNVFGRNQIELYILDGK
jgi:hypothetical protein